MSITITELLTEVGDDNLHFQILHQCMSGITKKKDGVSEVSFMTDGITPNDVMNQSDKIGLVIWVDRDDWESAIVNLEEKVEEPEYERK